MKRQKFIFLAIVMAFMPFTGWLTISTSAQVPSDLQTPAGDPATLLSPPALQVANMFLSGASDEDLLAAIANFPSAFSLTAQSIVCLQQIGVSSTVTIAMLNHDLFLNDNPGSALPIPLGPPANQPQILPSASFPESVDPSQSNDFQPQIDAASPEMDPSFSTLSQYGSWNFLPGSGWFWQPAYWLGYFYYPWGLTQIQNGRWCHNQSCGWIWFPNRNFCVNPNSFVAQRRVRQNLVQSQSSPTISHHSTMQGQPAGIQPTGSHHGHR